MPQNANLTQKLVINKLRDSSSIIFKWFNNNYMKVSSDRSHFLVSGNKKAIANIDNNCIESKDVHEDLVITIDSKLIVLALT